jgi:hypothetical protein
VNYKGLLQKLGIILLALLLVSGGVFVWSSRFQGVTVYVSQAQMNQLQSWYKDIVFFTSASNPIKSLDEVKNDEIGMWRGELLFKIAGLFGRDAFGLRVIGTGNASAHFGKNPKL